MAVIIKKEEKYLELACSLTRKFQCDLWKSDLCCLVC